MLSGAASLMANLFGAIPAIKSLLSCPKAFQARYSRGQIDVLPIRVKAWRLLLVYTAKKLIDKARYSAIARRVRAPIERSENGWNRNCCDPLTLGDKVRIIRPLKIRGQVVVFELRTKFEGQKFESFFPFSLHKRVDRLSSYKKQRQQFRHPSFAR